MIKLLGTQSNPILVSKSKHPFIIFNISSSSASRYNTITDMTTTSTTGDHRVLDPQISLRKLPFSMASFLRGS